MTCETKLLRDFVSPCYCTQLQELGVHNVTTYEWWMTTTGQWRIWTYAFDTSDIYRPSDDLIHRMYPATAPVKRIVAFTTGDLLHAMPPMLITTLGPHDYEVTPEVTHGSHAVRNSRLPDALACCLIGMISAGIYQADTVNQKIS